MFLRFKTLRLGVTDQETSSRKRERSNSLDKQAGRIDTIISRRHID
jgi:hypothetical protein